MKKLIYIGIIALISVAFVSCEDFSEIEQVDNNAVEVVTKDSSGSGGGSWGRNNQWVESDGRCIPKAVDCYDNVDIAYEYTFRDKFIKFLNEFWYLFLSTDPNEPNDPNNPNPADIINKYVAKEYIQGMVDGKLKSSISENKKTNTIFLIFSDIKSEKTTAVYPFVFKDKNK